MGKEEKVKRVPVNFDFSALNPKFLKGLAMIASYASEKYGSALQYCAARLEGEKSPINHAMNHMLSYSKGEAYDHFDGDPRWHLIAASYNLQMELFYADQFGLVEHPLVVHEVPVKTKRRVK